MTPSDVYDLVQQVLRSSYWDAQNLFAFTQWMLERDFPMERVSEKSWRMK